MNKTDVMVTKIETVYNPATGDNTFLVTLEVKEEIPPHRLFEEPKEDYLKRANVIAKRISVQQNLHLGVAYLSQEPFVWNPDENDWLQP